MLFILKTALCAFLLKVSSDKYMKSENFVHSIYWFTLRLRRTNVLARVLIEYLAYFYYSVFRRGKSFTFQGKKYDYFYHLYNRTIGSERIVEIPIAYKLLNEFKDKKTLEVGNVLSHYFPVTHDIIDKYERAKGIINEDVVEFKTKKRFDLILSISTMEHVGWTYGERRDPNKFFRGIANLKKHLAKNGVLMVTFPLFYRDDLTKLILDRKVPFSKEYFMKRTSFWNDWVEVDINEAAKENVYDGYFANANILYIGFYP